MRTTFRHLLAVALGAVCVAAVSASLIADSTLAPKALDALFTRYDREPDGPVKERLAAQIDALAHQKYATVSRLYWHTELASAQTAARVHGRPILHLRMLGRLDEDLSCTNSRLFRATLYANQDVSAFLRENFILYWSSERPVPRVTIDYGDGRRIERTTTGNSAHYVLDERGNVLDVLPGLYAPAAFRRALEESLALTTRVRGTSDTERAKLLIDYHQHRVTAASRDWQKLSGTPWIRGVRQLLTQEYVESAVIAAQRVTAAKMATEVPDLRYVMNDLTVGSRTEDQTEMWAALGQVLYGIGDVKIAVAGDDRKKQFRPVPVAGDDRVWRIRPLTVLNPPLPTSPRVLDDASRELVARMHDAVPQELRATRAQRDAMIARLEQSIVADSALNHLRLRPQISAEIVQRAGRIDFATLNDWIYAEVFRTPKQDVWLGLLPRNVFTGLPGDGVVIR